jgi:hypothetical protein
MEGEKLKWVRGMAMSLHVYFTVISKKDQLMKYENIKLILSKPGVVCLHAMMAYGGVESLCH